MRRESTSERAVFFDKLRGKNYKRPQYQLLKQLVRENDEIVFDYITRVGRSMNETLKNG
ncbi:recombinase family protein [Agaribacter marinus]|uniref:Recombinase family protein n=1 Tax=Virgibacillus salarius TaxID=447199 RepID=A0A941DUP6_9BACI|nr:recombinase family protein [Virgibacillus salarius]NAZ08782.1 recombinase family protein [Agaribacter marinus]